MNRYALIGAACVALALLAWHITAKSPPAAQTTITQQDRRFLPSWIAVRLGTVVHIRNDDNVTHHVYVDATNMKFDSGEQPIGTTLALPFNRRGTFDVQCAIHPTMHLKVQVE